MNIIRTLKVNCKDCNRCVRSCPVKAIGVSRHHAYVLEERCILCGKCVAECPQNAKQIRNQLTDVQRWLQGKRPVYLSLAPSFPAFPVLGAAETLPERLVALGFAAVECTTVGADLIMEEYRHLVETKSHPILSSCCPVTVDLVNKYYPQVSSWLAPVISPMQAHAKDIKQRCPDAKVVFVGPCLGKMGELKEPFNSVDAVLTFSQMQEWLMQSSENALAQENCWREGVHTRSFPLSSGITRSFLAWDGMSEDVVIADGLERCTELLQGLCRHEVRPRFVELLACPGGCLGGPLGGQADCLAARREAILQYWRKVEAEQPSLTKERPSLGVTNEVELGRTQLPRPTQFAAPPETEIRAILSQIGKYTQADERNCGACGYSTCREKATAVYYGVAETTMCVPYMRSKAESFAKIIVRNSLNAIIAVDSDMIVQECNPAAVHMFSGRQALRRGRPLGSYFAPDLFMEALQKNTKLIGKRVEYPEHKLVTEQMILPVPEHNLVIGIITNVTAQEKRLQDWEKTKAETMDKANAIIRQQMHVAQEIAGLLGETTADTKVALLELMHLLHAKEER